MRDVLSIIAAPYYAAVDFAMDAPGAATAMVSAIVVAVLIVILH